MDKQRARATAQKKKTIQLYSNIVYENGRHLWLRFFFSEEENDKDYYLNHSITIFSNLLIFSLYSTAKKTHRQLYVSYRLALN